MQEGEAEADAHCWTRGVINHFTPCVSFVRALFVNYLYFFFSFFFFIFICSRLLTTCLQALFVGRIDFGLSKPILIKFYVV